MKFEEALTLMRNGKKIRHPHFEPDVYLQTCRVGFIFDETPLAERQISIVKMKGEFQHEDMGSRNNNDIIYPGTMIIKEKYLEKPCKHGNYPQLNLLLIMADDWEIYES